MTSFSRQSWKGGEAVCNKELLLSMSEFLLFLMLFSSVAYFSGFGPLDFCLWPPVLEESHTTVVFFFFTCDSVLYCLPVGDICSGRKPCHTVC